MRHQQLIEKCLAGDPSAWEEFASRYARLLAFSARKRLERFNIQVDDLQVEEIVQQILVHLWEGKKLAQIRDQQRITAWLAVIAGNFALNYWRHQNRRLDQRTVSLSENLVSGTADEFLLSATVVAEGPSPREEIEQREQDQELYQALGQLSEREQIILKGAYFLNQTHEEISQMLGIPRNTVSTIIERAKKKLRKILEESEKGMKEK